MNERSIFRPCDREPLEVLERGEARSRSRRRRAGRPCRGAGGASRRRRGDSRSISDSVISRTSGRRARARSSARIAADLGGEPRLDGLARRDVDAHRQVGPAEPGVAPGAELPAGGLGDQPAERHDQAGRLGERDELASAGSARASGWRQRTSASKPTIRAVGELDDRLVVRARTASVVDRRRGARPPSRAGSGAPCPHRRVEDGVAAPCPRAFAAYIAASAWASRSSARSVVAAREGDPDADADDDRAAVELDRSPQLGGQPLGRVATASSTPWTRSSRIVNSSPPWRAAMSPARIVAARRWATSTRRRSPARWPSESLTTLKSSRSRNRTATLRPRRRPAGQGALEVLAEEDPVGEPGQRIVEGVVEELRLEPLLLGRVDEQALRDAPAVRGVVVHRVGLVVHPDDASRRAAIIR